ncbi:MAG: acetyl/propionyl/methylcrotonyl-CoA carboxylase subunit alpha [Nocardioidaceae bacterium]
MTIQRLLVANRGEIARRVFRTCRTLGIETVAVFSDADADLPFVREADSAVALPGNTPAETYLRSDLIVDAARRAGADAVHPGYGFLSENAAFARAVVDAGLTWVGPAPASIEQMGSKVEAKKLMADAGVPVLTELSPASVTEQDLPLLVKASAGGGGRGMRVVRNVDEVAAQVELASNEAASAFGDPTVFCEPYVERGRHVEVQVVGDTHGNVLVLGERDCSIQRRHQKVVEETPAPGLPDEVRQAMYDAARAAARAIDYVGAGTVEFLVQMTAGAPRFYFLEMNTRLQVEHPVTECVTGLDLVELQIDVAEGRRLAALDADPSVLDSTRAGSGHELTGRRGHAVEVRLYAEDPANEWQPQSGRLTRFDIPGVVTEFEVPASYGIRLDAGFDPGAEVGTHYDAMLAKVIAWAPTREQALRRLAATLAKSRIHGVRTNRDLLVNVLRHEAVLSGDVSTDFFDRHGLDELSTPPAGEDAVRLSAFAAALALAERDKAARREQRRIPVGWRNVTSQPLTSTFTVAGSSGDEVIVGWYGGRNGYRSADEWADDWADDGAGGRDVVVLEASADRVVLEELSGDGGATAPSGPDTSGVVRAFEVYVDGDRVDVESSLGHVALTIVPRFVDPADQVATGSLLAPMPGSVVSVVVEAGAQVKAGQPVLVLEAMKMQHTVSAPYDGVVTDVPVSAGEQVAAGAVLAVVHNESEAPEGETA